jgi:hypothetical protein
MATGIVVNKMDSKDEFSDSTEFDIETLDDIKQTGGANNNLKRSTNAVAESSALSKESSDKLNVVNSILNNKTNQLQSSNANPESETAAVESVANNETEPDTTTAVSNNETETEATVEHEIEESTNEQQTHKTKKASRHSLTQNKTKKNTPHVEVDNKTGVITINPATTHPASLFSKKASPCHMNIDAMRTLFKEEHSRVNKLGTEALHDYCKEAQNIIFDEPGADALVNGLLPIIDEHDLKKLILRKLLSDQTFNIKN